MKVRNVRNGGEGKKESWLLFLAIVAVVASGFVLLTTYSNFYNVQRVLFSPNPTGTAQVQISSNVDLTFTLSTINWGSGYVDPAQAIATLNTEGATTNFLGGGVTTVSNGFIIENTGNVDGKLEIKSSNDATTFIGPAGGLSTYKYKVKNCFGASGTGCTAAVGGAGVADTANACSDATPGTGFGSTYVDVNTVGNGDTVCADLNWENVQDSVRMDVQIVIDRNAAIGQKTSTITATATTSTTP